LANRKDGFEVIKGAAKAFVEIGAPAVEPLVAALKDEHNMWAAEVLGMIGDARAVEPLIAALEHGYEGLRQVPALRAALPVRRCLARVEQQWRP
jgi:HEAT repeat protein